MPHREEFKWIIKLKNILVWETFHYKLKLSFHLFWFPFPQLKGNSIFWYKRMKQCLFVGDKHVKNVC